MKHIRKIKTKINTLLIDKTFAFAKEIEKLKAKKHLVNLAERRAMDLRVKALREIIGELLALRNIVNSMFNVYIYEGVIE